MKKLNDESGEYIMYLIQNSQAVIKCAALKKAIVKKDVQVKKAKKWL